eukprot:4788198-Alexandrium_andersonii.AAC.1
MSSGRADAKVGAPAGQRMGPPRPCPRPTADAALSAWTRRGRDEGSCRPRSSAPADRRRGRTESRTS